MKTTDFSNASAALVDLDQLLNVEKKYAFYENFKELIESCKELL